jgi:hypothetical protein
MTCPSGGRGVAAELEGAGGIMGRRIGEDELIEHFTLYREEHELLGDKSGWVAGGLACC